MIILYPILIFLSKTVNGKFSLLQMFPPPKFSSPSLDLHNLRFLTPNFFSPAFFSHPTSFSPGISFKNFFPSKFLSPERFCHCRSPSLLIFSLPHSSLIQPPPFPKSPPTSHLQKVFLPQKFPPSEKALSPQIPLPDNFFSPVIPFLSANRVSFLLSFFPSFLLSFFPSFLLSFFPFSLFSFSFSPSFFLPGLSRSSVFSFSTNKKPPVFTDGFFAFSFFAAEAYSAGCCSTAGVSLSALSTCSAAASRKARISLSFCAATRFRLRSTVPVPAGIRRPTITFSFRPVR